MQQFESPALNGRYAPARSSSDATIRAIGNGCSRPGWSACMIVFQSFSVAMQASVKSLILETDRLLLRPFLLSDASDVQRLAGNRAIADTTLNVPHPYEDGMAEAWISTHQPKFEAGELAVLAITLKADGELVGAVGLRVDRSFDRANLGYWIGEPFWGLGYCTEAATSIVEYGFVELELHRLHAEHLERNPASGRVLQKIGMLKEGTARQHTKKWGKFEDLVLYGLLRNEWVVYDVSAYGTDIGLV